MKEILLDRQSIYNGKIVSLFKDTVECSNGVKSSREVVDHKPAVVVIPIHQDGSITLIKQYRHAVNKVLIECPAGCVDKGEDMLQAAQRELAEECGLKAINWQLVHTGFPTPGFCNEIYYLYVAKNLSNFKLPQDKDEVIQTLTLSFSEFENLVFTEKISDIKTLLAYYILKAREDLF